MKGSKWLVLIVVLVVVGVVIAKEARNSSHSPEPEVVAQAPTEREPAPPAVDGEAPDRGASFAPTQAEHKPVPSSPLVRPAEGSQPQTQELSPPAEVKALGNPTPAPPGQQPAEQRPALGPKPEGPLPGSKLKECLKNGLPTMADFGLGTCSPCKAMEPILKQATQDYWGRANILFVELDKYPELGREYGIRVMPTQIFFDASGNQVDYHMGFMDREEIDSRLAAAGAGQ